ncbi:GPP34 family phosphoprotein [Nocardia sp. CDC159]|uniref:GPP34 family phosphoprotein n=1 Tax=Nocardia pulmonis TaxID=2951408 RepID=A0A9X2EFZ8_9NOCA|nr:MULTISPECIES: GPP34 family phosphoprotein [Nocardia]MCM6778815.1 GPP34 family phosphoprotein [Nocardia pulmonis]MCM6791704.1 GPP34 family phosphoprotein [Nocardia sp. CDC159]
MLTVAEEFLLLALDDSGKQRVADAVLGAALAGAALVELTLDGALRVTERGDPAHKPGRLAATERPPSDARLADLVGVAQGRKPKDAIGKVAGFGGWHRRAKDLREALLGDLVDRGYLRVARGRALGLFPTTVWQPVDPAPAVEIVARVRAAVEGRSPDDRTAALISILYAVGLLPKVVSDIDKRTVRRRGKEISAGEWGGPAVRKAVQEVQGAAVATIVAVSVATSTGE